jgi:hypothetical protein
VVKAYNQEVVGLSPGTIYWKDVSHASYYVNMKITKIKVAKWGISKIFFNGIFQSFVEMSALLAQRIGWRKLVMKR